MEFLPDRPHTARWTIWAIFKISETDCTIMIVWAEKSPFRPKAIKITAAWDVIETIATETTTQIKVEGGIVKGFELSGLSVDEFEKLKSEWSLSIFEILSEEASFFEKF